MQILSYNPQDDEYFIGLTLEEFEQVSKDYAISYDYGSSYEKEKQTAICNQKRQEFCERIKKLYGIENTPAIFVVTDGSGASIAIRPWHFPCAPLWNGYSPWKSIFAQRIDNLNLHSIKINYKKPEYIILEFCEEWIAKFSNEATSAYQLLDDNNFPNYCKSLGWTVDNGVSFREKYPCDSYDDALKYLPQVTDSDLLGTLIFSYWRYFNHWTNSSQEILDHKEWFIKTLNRLKTIANNN